MPHSTEYIPHCRTIAAPTEHVTAFFVLFFKSVRPREGCRESCIDGLVITENNVFTSSQRIKKDVEWLGIGSAGLPKSHFPTTMRDSTMTTSTQTPNDAIGQTITRCSSGCPGLDDVLGGGLPVGHIYLIEGEPGTGKTTLALQFIAEGLKRGENVLYVTLSESRHELVTVAQVHRLGIDDSVILEVRPSEEDLKPDGQYTVFHPAEVELTDRVQTIMAEVDRRKPSRLVIDALSEVRMLAKDPLRYRRQVLSLKEYAPQSCTVMLLDDRSSRYADLELHSIVHGVVSMSRVSREYGKTMRRLEVTKLRGCAFREASTTISFGAAGLSSFLASWPQNTPMIKMIRTWRAAVFHNWTYSLVEDSVGAPALC